MNILMLNQDQFGYKAGYYHYCKHLSAQGHNIVYLCNDQNLDRMELANVKVVYVNEPNSVKWRIKFIPLIKRIIKEHDINIILCSYYKGCSLHTCFFCKIPSIMDIRSGDLSSNKLKRWILNRFIKMEASFFSQTMIMAESLAQKLKLKKGSYGVIPLGSDVISDADKDFKNLSLLYVGTLYQRDIYKTIEGVRLFKDEFPNVNLRYDIIGFGNEGQHIVHLISKLGLSDNVTFHGRINYENLKPFFDKANIGVAFVPQTPYFEYQPSTKIFEYVLSGMYCMATNTYENRLCINDKNGILHDDNAEAFFLALKSFYLSDRTAMASEGIRATMLPYRLWSNIVSNQLLPLMADLIPDK